MSNLNANIILQGRQPDLMGSYARSLSIGNALNQITRQREVQDIYRQHGAGAMQGNQNALAAIAGVDPAAAQNLMEGQLGMQAQRLNMDYTRQRIEISNVAEKRKIAELKRQMSADEAAARAKAIRDGLAGASFFVERGDEAGYIRHLQENGVNPAQFPMQNFEAHARQLLGWATELEKPSYREINGQLVQDNAPGGPAVVGVDGLESPAPEWRDATQEEMKRGIAQVNTRTGANKYAPKGMKLTADGKGGVTLTTGVGADALSQGPSVGDVYNPGDVAGTIELIDGLLGHEHLDRVLGPIVGGGGNNVDDLNMAQRMYYGSGGLDAIERINQLQSRGWLAARDMLKGGGAITDFESNKAEAAVARLSRTKDPIVYREALKELRDAITEGMAKLEAAKGGEGGVPMVGESNVPDFTQMTNEQIQKWLEENPE